MHKNSHEKLEGCHKGISCFLCFYRVKLACISVPKKETERTREYEENHSMAVGFGNDCGNFHWRYFGLPAGTGTKWYNAETGVGYLPSEIPEETAATYVAVNPNP